MNPTSDFVSANSNAPLQVSSLNFPAWFSVAEVILYLPGLISDVFAR
jgi:hypothetical protein